MRLKKHAILRKLLLQLFITWPLCVWLQPPGYAVFAIIVAVGALAEAALR